MGVFILAIVVPFVLTTPLPVVIILNIVIILILYPYHCRSYLCRDLPVPILNVMTILASRHYYYYRAYLCRENLAQDTLHITKSQTPTTSQHQLHSLNKYTARLEIKRNYLPTDYSLIVNHSYRASPVLHTAAGDALLNWNHNDDCIAVS
jgi:hypothetical protein